VTRRYLGCLTAPKIVMPRWHHRH
jgi:hypothetical protein